VTKSPWYLTRLVIQFVAFYVIHVPGYRDIFDSKNFDSKSLKSSSKHFLKILWGKKRTFFGFFLFFVDCKKENFAKLILSEFYFFLWILILNQLYN
jgi:hypothetical protein